MSAAVPITLLTGFLGSGKTTLLARLLRHPRFVNTAVLVNELGEIALDHDLLYGSAESIVLLDRGCLCCALRSDLARQLDELYTRRLRREIPAFERVVIETTGLADPAPILQTLVAEPVIAALYRLDGVVTVVDGQLGEQELDRHFESVKQAAVADRIVISKADLVDGGALSHLERRLRHINPAAPMERCVQGELDPAFLLDVGLNAALSAPARIGHWLQAERYVPLPARAGAGSLRIGRHDRTIASFALTFDAPVSGAKLWSGLETLIERSGDRLLRVKGLVNAIGQVRPKVIHIVQHVLYPVLTLPAWPSDDHTTRIVFIVCDLEREQVEAVLQSALGAA